MDHLICRVKTFEIIGDYSLRVSFDDGTAQSIYDAHTVNPDGKLSVTASFGKYKVTLSLNKISGKTYDSYYYCSTAVIQEVV